MVLIEDITDEALATKTSSATITHTVDLKHGAVQEALDESGKEEPYKEQEHEDAEGEDAEGEEEEESDREESEEEESDEEAAGEEDESEADEDDDDLEGVDDTVPTPQPQPPVVAAASSKPQCARCAKPATKRCSRCKFEWYCGIECQRMSWGTHRKTCALPCAAAAEPSYALNFENKRLAPTATGGESAGAGGAGMPKGASGAPLGGLGNVAALLKSLGLDNVSEETAREQIERIEKELLAKEASKALPPRVLEGWWYESMQPTESDAVPGAPRLRQVAVASVEAAMAECEWETALEHLFTAMELTPRGDRAIGTLHAQCCECCLRLVSTKERDAYNVRYCDSALEHSETAVRLWPDWAEAYAGRAAALEACGRLLEACDEYRHAIALAEDEGREETAEASGKEGAPLLAKLRGALEAATTKLADSEARDQLR
jgi:hypothetical protein